MDHELLTTLPNHSLASFRSPATGRETPPCIGCIGCIGTQQPTEDRPRDRTHSQVAINLMYRDKKLVTCLSLSTREGWLLRLWVKERRTEMGGK